LWAGGAAGYDRRRMSSSPAPDLRWFVLTMLLAVAANAVAVWTTTLTVDLMRDLGPFATTVRAFEDRLLPFSRATLFPLGTLAVVVYLWPLVQHFRAGCPTPAPVRVQRRVVGGPLAVAAIGFAGWCVGFAFFPTVTLLRFGTWAPSLMSQQILSPLVSGFLAATLTYLTVDLVFRRRVVACVVPDGRLADVPGAFALGVRGRLVVFLIATAFVPIFTLFGLIRSAVVRLGSGIPVEVAMADLAVGSGLAFGTFLAIGLGLTLVLARTFTDPLAAVASGMRRVRAGDLDARVQVTAADELGVLEDGLNAMVEGLRERERILTTFGRVVEPVVRDRLLAGDLAPGGETRVASVLFCDLRDFTSLAERLPPAALVETLNAFFTSMTAWARGCGGFVDKFIGDALLVVFGLFDDDGRGGAAAAVHCAAGMRERLAELNARRADAGVPPLRLKIGVHTGPVIAGLIGAADRHEFTVVGDTVNVAARLEALCREYGCDVLVSDATWTLAGDPDLGCPVAVHGGVALRGRDAPVRVYALGQEPARAGR
jgi:adenylate cyclase